MPDLSDQVPPAPGDYPGDNGISGTKFWSHPRSRELSDFNTGVGIIKQRRIPARGDFPVVLELLRTLA
ncbi:hypothetical protein J7355_13190 [Endozoicomonas sp. G2_2]|uniref:hypothetical protein n=1 Tax=Endozoicomonas sp. G2_2 TaxID=2821092 RepID=UPI001ADA483D|nr:hypothetical protein [Endozoicomonas sp. G2_2]MBO9471049.1 hypothetical protein [Endozoicomonas sp. G2_2]